MELRSTEAKKSPQLRANADKNNLEALMKDISWAFQPRFVFHEQFEGHFF